ncbi:putative olfactory receptor 14L1 [Eublepharis macularius]|uniref:Olfactory receptor n=1 Tax=Eublepharis macularius TaxID=481883 RepID=A0AA97K302_EUBMA|nr:putative olfactory receptor 14L1 [Eublepharis macularius]
MNDFPSLHRIFQINQMKNQSTVTEFFLMGFAGAHEEQIFHFVIFFSIYIVALIGNILIIITVSLNHQLHTPMYFFLVNLSLSDICFISITVPKSMATSLTNHKLISFYGCVCQVFFINAFVGIELTVLTIMAYDRYVAICHPLRYRLIMNWGACAQMTAASWISSVTNAVLQTNLTFKLSFCGSNVIEQFFCDIPHLQKISCTDPKVNQILILALGLVVVSFCILFIFVSYGYIFSAVLKISSVQGRYKAFSTCTPHLMVFSLFMLMCTFSYMKPKELSSPTVDLVSAVLYAVLPPVLNPIIYSLRNKDIQEAVCKMSKKLKLLLHDFLGLSSKEK